MRCTLAMIAEANGWRLRKDYKAPPRKKPVRKPKAKGPKKTLADYFAGRERLGYAT